MGGPADASLLENFDSSILLTQRIITLLINELDGLCKACPPIVPCEVCKACEPIIQCEACKTCAPDVPCAVCKTCSPIVPCEACKACAICEEPDYIPYIISLSVTTLLLIVMIILYFMKK